MRSTGFPPGRHASGALSIWTMLAIAALICIVAVLVFQVREYLYYGQPPSVWPGAGPSSTQQTVMEPLKKATVTDVTPAAEEEVLPKPSVDETTGSDAAEEVSDVSGASEVSAGSEVEPGE